MGYAFINFIDAIYIVDFFQQFKGKRWECFNSDKICKISYGRIQGKQALENNFANMNVPQNSSYGTTKVRPLILDPKMPSLHDIESQRQKFLLKKEDYKREFNHEWEK